MTTDPAPRPEGGDDERRSESSEPPAAPRTDTDTDSDTETEPFLNPPEHERRPGDG
jgi:hypothetical protein